jgi:predicted metal-dependent enzyme (double-stranded beta helix superfamily)
MTYTSANYSLPKSLKLTKPANKVNLIVHGQSVVFFNATDDCALIFCDAKSKPGLRVDFTKTEVFACLEPSKKGLVDKNNKKGLSDNQGVYYWLSLDSQNQRLYAGVGEARVENAIYKYQFDRDDNWQNNKLFLESLTTVVVERLQITSLLRDPITSSVPLLVKDTDELTMNHIAAGIHMPKANLSHTSQKLYDCITGKNFVLNTKDFPNFTKAIEYSIKTPGMWCHERLKQKATEFNKDKPDYKETYLRITLNENNGESPGIPYVMEIWPVGHYSPIHNHGSSSAVIRVLNGSINVSMFPYLSADVVEPFATADFKKNHITWISPTLNQVHQLKNLDGNKDTCITIQCYMYEGENTAHYDYFDYLDADGKSQQYEPDSDMGFLEFKKTMKEEWKGRRRSWLGC